MYGGEGKCIWGFSGEPEGKSHLVDPSIDGSILKCILKK